MSVMSSRLTLTRFSALTSGQPCVVILSALGSFEDAISVLTLLF